MPSRPVGPAGSTRINFRPSPFYEIKQFVSSIVQCPEAPTQSDRKNVPFFVNLTTEQVDQLRTSKYQLRLFCTTVEAHAASLSGRNPATVEFPLTCEVRVNSQPLSINLRGSKKQAGRVPPPNLNKDSMLALKAGRPNRIDLTYTNAPKRHVLVAAICEITTVETLVEHLRSRQLRSKEEVLLKMRREAEDDDIEQGAATMSLKCPFSYMRITTPCRSVNCLHVQCFDAYSFFSINEQTPSWACPVCQKTIKPEDLLMDGYVDEILKKVPHDEESVIIEPDGSWRTSDGKISSSGSAQATPAADGTSLVEDRSQTQSLEDVKPGNAKPNGAGRASRDDIVVLDSPSPPPETTAPSISASTSATGPTQPPVVAASSSSCSVETRTAPSVQASTLAVGATTAPSVLTSSAAMGVNASTSNAPPSHNGVVPTPSASHSAGALALAPRCEHTETLDSSTTMGAHNAPTVGVGEGGVIDLTLDSDDEDSEPSVPRRPAPSIDAHPNPLSNSMNSGYLGHHSISSNNNRGGGFANYASKATSMSARIDPFASAMSRVEATPEDEQIRRPGKRPRIEAIPTPNDPRLVKGVRPVERERRSSLDALPASYLDVGINGINGSQSNGRGYEAANTTSNGGGTRADGNSAAARGASGEDDGDDSWMDNANTSDHDQYINEEDWWA